MRDVPGSRVCAFNVGVFGSTLVVLRVAKLHARRETEMNVHQYCAHDSHHIVTTLRQWPGLRPNEFVRGNYLE